MAEWRLDPAGRIGLHDVVRHVRPTILLGASAQPGAFTEPIIRDMAAATERPIVFPLSNPTARTEAVPADIVDWTSGRAFVATGSPYPPVEHEGRRMRIGQCNNALVFPGIGLGAIASGASRVSDDMFVAAARALSEWSPARRRADDALYPPLEQVGDVARDVALAVGIEAQRAGLADQTGREELRARIDARMWEPRYVPYRRIAPR